MSLTQSHSIVCNSSREAIYSVISDSSHWPECFEPCISVEVIKRDNSDEHIRITARVGGTPMTWESRRKFLREIFGIDTEVLKPMPLVKRMNTIWRVISVNSCQCVLVLEHEYEIIDKIGDEVVGVTTREQAECFVANAIHENSTIELKNIRDAAKLSIDDICLLADRSTSHSIVCHSRANEVYQLITDVSNWPLIFENCVSASELSRNDNNVLIKIEALQNGRLVSWETSRTYYENIFRIDFSLPVPMPFMKYMRGQWRVIPIDNRRSVLHVTRHFALTDKIDGIRDDVKTLFDAEAMVMKFIEENSKAELRAIQAFTEYAEATFATFKESFTLPYAPEEVYSVLNDITLWPKVLPHCESLDVLYNDSENQEFIMRVKTPLGSESFRSIRTCKSDDLSISYFQPKPPEVLKTHYGNWVVKATREGSEIVSEHTVRVNQHRCKELFGGDDLKINKQRIKQLILSNSKATVDACGTWLEKSRKTA